ncbi:MAG: response regulator [Acholeplasmatales bacterium]|nr:MAG: response regulator [Acholeplasmatales bacterium]
MRLLIVDDEIWSRTMIRKILPWRDIGFSDIEEAGDGQAALAILAARPVDLMITDMRMPRLDGADMLKQVRTAQYAVEIIVMSGYEDYAYLHEALKTKATDYLLKPVVRAELEKAVSRALDIIHERQNYHHIEQILVHEDLSNTLTRYYECKNLTYKSLSTQDATKLAFQVDQLEALVASLNTQLALKAYIEKDFMHFVHKLEKEHQPNQALPIHVDHFNMADVRERLTAILHHLIHQEVHHKINILDVQKHIDAHFVETISLADVAKRFHISKEHLSRLFKKEVGTSVQAYITGKKIEHAKGLLNRYRSLSMATIGMMSGFVDAPYFHRVFRNHTGMTPKQYRG